MMIRDKPFVWALLVALGIFLAAPGFQDTQRAPQAAQKKAAPRDRPAVIEARPGLEPKAIDLLKLLAAAWPRPARCGSPR